MYFPDMETQAAGAELGVSKITEPESEGLGFVHRYSHST
jgi:hypothetical protein